MTRTNDDAIRVPLQHWAAGVVAMAMATLVLLGGAWSAAAATLVANYQLRGDHASEIGGAPELVDLGTDNRFAVELVDGVARPVLTFPRGGGLSSLTTGLLDPNDHSVVMLFRLAEVSGYRRLLDFSGGTSDNGLYDLNGRAVLYVNGNAAMSHDAVFGDSYVQLALTSAAAPGGSHDVAVYVNGTPVAATRAVQGFGLATGILRFFEDNTTGPAVGEESAGAVACILMYDGALPAGEVRRLAADRAPCPSAQPPAFAPRVFTGTTSQHLPVLLTVDQPAVASLYFHWRARCADGRIHTSMSVVRTVRAHNGRFVVDRALDTGGSIHVSGKLVADRAAGSLSRMGRSAFGTTCTVRGLRWHARATRASSEYSIAVPRSPTERSFSAGLRYRRPL